MKLSVSLPDEDVSFLDEYSESRGIPSRSAVLQKAVRLLRATELGSAYQQAWDDDSDDWDSTVGDGLV